MMKRVLWAVAFIAAVCVSFAIVPGVANAERANSECAVCHGAGSMVGNAVFQVGGVDKRSACPRCHLDSLAGAHPIHYAGGNCGGPCHRGFGPSLAARTPSVVTSVGAFASVTSPNVSSSALHAIHSTPRWESGFEFSFSACSSCHAVAACGACHTGSPAIHSTHAEHGVEPTSAPIVAWVGDLSYGVNSSQAEQTALKDAEVRCGYSGCHDIVGRSQSNPHFMDCYEHPAYPDKNYLSSVGRVVRIGTWQYLLSATCSLQRETHANSPAASITIRFDGEVVSVEGTKDQYRGIGEILIDGVSQGTFDQFNATTQRQRPVWTSGNLGPGEHTITIRPTGTKNPLARGTWVSLDHITIYPEAPRAEVPRCISCHPDQGEDSHYGASGGGFTHDATQTISAANQWDTGFGTYTCERCHLSPLIGEHRRPTSSGISAPSSCAICHPVLAPASWTGAYSLTSGCDYGECHSVASGRARHAAVEGAHLVSSGGESLACTACHTSDMRVAHANSVPANGHLESEGCLACHGTTKLANAAGGCTSAGCHPSTFNAMADHSIADASSHLVSGSGTPFTRAYQGSASLDDGGLECSACHSAHLFAAHSEEPSVSCSSGGSGGTGCHLDTALSSVAVAAAGWTSRRCLECHESGSNRSHDSTTVAHYVASNTCAGSGTYCHAGNDLWRLHASAQNGGAPRFSSCANAGCHDALDRRPTVFAENSCGAGSGGCHQSYTVTHAQDFKHAFSTASHYSTITNSGCTNQIGCHAGASTEDFGAVHHPDTGCFEGACHQSASKEAFSGRLPTDCQECHVTAGGFSGAPARTVLEADPLAGGHYSSSVHAASGLGGSIGAGGTAQATCAQCHNPVAGGSATGLMNQHTNITIAGSPYGTALACGECHGDTRSFGYGQVDAGWSARTCASCHTAGASSVFDHALTAPAVSASVSTGCGATGSGCHPSNDLHGIHRDAQSCALAGCHDYALQAAKPTVRACGIGNGGCHTTDPHDPSAHATLASGSCVVCHESGDLRVVHGDDCGLCHGNEAHPSLPAGRLECVSCHVSGVVGVKSYSPVDPSHYSGTEAAHTAGSQSGTVSGFDCTQCHSMEMRPEHVVKTTSSFAATTTPEGKCIACHEGPVDSWAGAPWARTCDACHATRHDAIASKHDATSAGAGCAGLTAQLVTVEAQGFETAGVWPSDWTRSDGTYQRLSATAPYEGAYSAEAWANNTTRRTVSFQKTFDLSGYSSPSLEFQYFTAQLESGDFAQVQVSTNGTTFTDLMPQTFANVGWTQRSYALPVSATVTVRFIGSVNATNEFVRYDAIVISGTTDVSNCHDVSDVGALHAPSTSSCAACHVSAAAVPTALACATAGCHSATGHGHELDVSGSAGCYGSGIGCHTDTSTDYADHHPSSGCTDGLCHRVEPGGAVNPSKATHPNPNTCQDCHDSSYVNAPDTVPMTGSVPNGHYADALHTAGSTQASATYSYASKTTACAACHAMALAGEHARTTSNLTGEGETVCTKCHNDSQAIADIIKAGWVAKDTASACAACHAGTDGTSAATAHGSVATAHTGTSVTGCTGLGAGCHGTSATPDLTVVHASGCAQARACHSPTVYNPGAKNCTNALCHPSAVYNTTTYAHGAVDGTDPAHTVAAASMDTVVRVGTGSATATCSTCHASTLKSAHDTAAGHATASLGWTNECRGCHNATSPIDVAALVASNSWTKSCTGNGCHDTAQAAHVAGGTAVPAVAGSNSTTPACTKSGCHSTLELHALHKNASGGCGLSDPNGGCHTAANRDRRPTQRTCGDVGGCHEGIQDDGAHGVSSGGVPCDVCHSALTGMVDDRDAYHHVLDGPDPFMAPNVGGAYPTSKTDLACVSCHVDHDKYSALPGGAGKAFSLRSSATSSNPVVADTDDTLCMSCHTTALARNVIGQKDNVIPEPGVWKIEQLWWDVSPHNYTAPGDFNDGSTFHANCAKCHGTLGGTLSTGKFAVHFSPEQRLINALGDTVTYNVNEEQMCFRCHSLVTDFTAYGGPQPGIPKPSSYVDWYGTQSMKVSNVVIFQQMTSGNNGHGHKPHLYHNIHLLNETQAQISATKHVECADCHNHHVVGTARHEFGTTNTVSDAIRGVTGQAFTSTNIGTTNMPSDAQVNSNLSWKTYSDYEYEICFKCHSSANTNYATWGGNKSSLSDVGAAKPYNWAAYVGPSPTVTAPRWTNIAKDFHVGNQSRHPVLAPLPTTDPSTSYGSSRVYAGQLSAGWKPGDTMYCSDCHGDPNAPSPWQLDVNGSPVLDVNGDPIINPAMANFAQGPHGSSVAFSLRGPRTDWPIATTGPQAGQLITLNMLNAGYDNLFCTNCHPGVRANKVHGGGQGTHAAAACVNCHILIPHGGGMSRLIGDGEGPSGGPSAMPVRYAYNNDKRTMYVASFNKKADPSTYAKGDCSVTSQAGATCGGGGQRHVTGNNASLENW